MTGNISSQSMSPWNTYEEMSSSHSYGPSQSSATREVACRERSTSVNLQLGRLLPFTMSESLVDPSNASPITDSTYGSLPSEGLEWSSSPLNPDNIDIQPTNTERYRCRWEGCTHTGSFTRETCLWRHIKSQHVRASKYKCSDCFREFGRKDKFLSHQRSCGTLLRPKIQDVTSQSTTSESRLSLHDIMDTTTDEHQERDGIEASQPLVSSSETSMGQAHPPKDIRHLEGGIVSSKSRNSKSPATPSSSRSKDDVRLNTQASDHGPSSNRGLDNAISTKKGSSRNLEHILDPATYYDKLEMLELDTAEMCGIASGPDTEDLSPSAYFEMIENTGKALRHLQSEGFCGDRFSVFIEEHHRSNVARITHLSLHDIDEFVRSHVLEFSSHTQRIRGPLSPLLNKIFGGPMRNPQVADSWNQLKVLSKTLSVGLVSFSGSHACPFDINIWGRSLEEIPVGCGYSFRYRQLACLKDFLNGHCWVLGSTEYESEQEGLKVSLTVEDFQDLWGPVQFVGGTSISAPLMRTEKGFVIPLPRQYQPDQSLSEIECHWAKEVPHYVEDADHIWLQNTSRILIGTDSTARSSMTVNLRCNSKIHQIEEHIADRLRFPGTCKDYYTMEGHDIQFQAGYSGFNIGFILKRRRHPGKTLKDSIITECHQNDPDIIAFLKLQIGLEISACTGNARRVSLWEAIRLYLAGRYNQDFTECGHDIADPECVRTCWSRYNPEPSNLATDNDSSSGSSRTVNTTYGSHPSNPLDSDSFRKLIITSIFRLKNTGIDHEGKFQACWPFSIPTMSHQIKPTKFNRWMNLLSDSRETATFAVVSPRCLRLQKDHFPMEWSLCPKSHRELKQNTCLSTRILRRYESPRKQRFRRRQFGVSSPSPDCDSGELAQGTAIRMGERQLSVIKFWRDDDNQNLIAHPIPGGQLREVTAKWSSAPDFVEQVNPDLKAGELIDLIVPSMAECGENSGNNGGGQ